MTDPYWRQFPVQLDYTRPFDTGWARIVDLDQLKTVDGLIPRITLRKEDGSRVVLVAAPKLLRNRLVDIAPARGDMLRVAYTGEAKTAPAGMRPTKHFKVGWRPGKVPDAPPMPDPKTPDPALPNEAGKLPGK